MSQKESTHAIEHWLNIAAKDAVDLALGIQPVGTDRMFEYRIERARQCVDTVSIGERGELTREVITIAIANLLRASVVIRREETRR